MKPVFVEVSDSGYQIQIKIYPQFDGLYSVDKIYVRDNAKASRYEHEELEELAQYGIDLAEVGFQIEEALSDAQEE